MACALSYDPKANWVSGKISSMLTKPPPGLIGKYEQESPHLWGDTPMPEENKENVQEIDTVQGKKEKHK